MRRLGFALGSVAVEAVVEVGGGGGGKRMVGGSSRGLECVCARRRGIAAPAARPAATPGTYFTFLGLGGSSSAPSPSEEDEASEERLPWRPWRGWLCRLAFWVRIAAGPGSAVASGEEGDAAFSGKLRLRPRE